MIDVGEMVVCDGRTARVLDIEGNIARCGHIDRHGDYLEMYADVDDIEPLWLALQPKTMWPDSFEGDDNVRTRAPNRRAAA